MNPGSPAPQASVLIHTRPRAPTTGRARLLGNYNLRRLKFLNSRYECLKRDERSLNRWSFSYGLSLDLRSGSRRFCKANVELDLRLSSSVNRLACVLWASYDFWRASHASKNVAGCSAGLKPAHSEDSRALSEKLKLGKYSFSSRCSCDYQKNYDCNRAAKPYNVRRRFRTCGI